MGIEEGDISRAKVGGDGIEFYQCADNHQRTGQGARKPDAHLVEDQPGEEEHQQEDIDKAACAGEEAIV